MLIAASARGRADPAKVDSVVERRQVEVEANWSHLDRIARAREQHASPSGVYMCGLEMIPAEWPLQVPD